MVSPYRCPPPVSDDPISRSNKAVSFLSWWGAVATLCWFVVEGIYGWPQAKAEKHEFAAAASYFVGHILAGVAIPALLAWIVFRTSSRSQRASTITFAAVTGLMCLSVIRPAARGHDGPVTPARVSTEDFSFAVPEGWEAGRSEREKTQVVLAQQSVNGVTGMIQVDVGGPSLPSAKATALALAGADGRLVPGDFAVDGVAGIRVETPAADLSRPRLAAVILRNGKAYLIMAAGQKGNDISSAFDHVVSTWRWGSR